MGMEEVLRNLSLPPDELSGCVDMAREKGIPLEQELLACGHISEEQYLELAGQRYGMEVDTRLHQEIRKDDAGLQADAALLRRLSFSWLKRHRIVPLRDRDGQVVLAASRPSGWLLAQELGLLTGERPVRCLLAPEAAIEDIINHVFGDGGDGEDDSVADMLDSAEIIDVNEDAVEDLLEESSDAPFIKTVNAILAQAVRAGASDIHIEPYRDVSRVRFRLDGVLYERHTIKKVHHAAVVSRIKVMAKLNIAEKRLPQDGRIAIVLGGRQVGLRVSTLPTSFGERVVLRLLEKSERVLSLEELGLERSDFRLLSNLVASSHGIVLVTGPTGSGKTTTLYAVLQKISSPDRNILTIEDPVEYELDGIGQMQVNPRIDLTFANGLRALVRQDPDVILIGEIRDGETASIAVQSALTGHLVFSTLHTNDAPGAVTRLFDMGVEPFLLSSVLRGAIAQRLVRTLCPHCRIPGTLRPAEAELFAAMGLEATTDTVVYHPGGCDNCLGTGYRGRMAIYEIMPVGDSIRRLIVEKADANVLRRTAEGENMHSLHFDGLRKVLEGKTSIEEVERVVRL